jgi:hypothetical protein
LFFDPENGKDMFPQNVGSLSTDYKAVYPQKTELFLPDSIFGIYILPVLIPMLGGSHATTEWRVLRFRMEGSC